MNLTINPILPSEDSLIIYSKNWWKHHEHINMMEWNDKVKESSFEFKIIDIPLHIINLMLKDNTNTKELNTINNYFIESLKGYKHIDSFFAKLITRSPKDYLDGGYKLSSVKEMTNALCSSMRTFEDMCVLRRIPEKAKLVVRPFINIPKEKEFRVFIKDYKINGITQYHWDRKSEWINENSYFIEKSIRVFVESNIIPNIKKSDFVLDLFFNNSDYPKLIEINPYGLSDPCMFFDYNSLNNSFKFVK